MNRIGLALAAPCSADPWSSTFAGVGQDRLIQLRRAAVTGLAASFAGGRQAVAAGGVAVPDLLRLPGVRFSRASLAWASKGGVLVAFAAGQTRFTDAGLLLGVAAVRLSRAPRDAAGWIADSGAAVDTLGTADGFLRRRVSSSGLPWSRLSRLNTPGWTAGARLHVRARYEAGDSGQVRIVFRDMSAGQESNVAGPVGAPIVVSHGAGAVSDVRTHMLGGGVFETTYVVTAASAGSGFSLGVGPNSTRLGESVIMHGAQVSSAPSEWILHEPDGEPATAMDSLWIETAPLGLPPDQSFHLALTAGTSQQIQAVGGRADIPAGLGPILALWSS